MTKLEQAARQALDALEEAYENGFLTGIAGLKTIDTITALREALAEQVEQEPIYISESCAERGCACHYSVEVDGEPVAVYSTPVRTKDLTDDEIDRALGYPSKYRASDKERDDARAVIAADREKNK